MKFYQRYALFLSASIIRAVISFITFPIATRILDADDYGTYALVVSLVLLVMTFANAGGEYLLNYYFIDADEQGQRELISSMLMISTALFGIFGMLFMLGWHFAVGFSEMLVTIPVSYVWLVLVSVALTLPSQTILSILTIKRQAFSFAVIVILESVTAAASLIFSLFILNLDITALFLSGLAAALVNFIASMILLRPYLTWQFNIKWLRTIIKYVPAGFASDMSTRGSDALRNTLLSSYVGLATLGIFSHSQRYQQLVFMYAKAASRSVYPTSIEESKTPPYTFTKTGIVWHFIHMSFVLSGIFFAFFGREVVSVLSNDKFTDAAVLVPFWMITLLLQYMAQPQHITLMTHNDGIFMLWGHVWARIASIIVMIILIPLVGIWGALITEMVWMLVYRVLVTIRARKFVKAPFQDKWVLMGSAIILISVGIGIFYVDQLAMRLIAAAIISLITLAIAYPDIHEAFDVVQSIMTMKHS